MHMSQLMPLPLTVSCFSKIQIGFTFLVLAHLGSPGKRAVKRVCVCVVYWFQTSNMSSDVLYICLCTYHIPPPAAFARMTCLLSIVRRHLGQD